MAGESGVLDAERDVVESDTGRAEAGFPPLVAKSAAMQEVVRLVERATEGDFPVLLLGEAGSGKSLIAETIHRNSERRHGPLIRVHLGMKRDAALESQLFGMLDGETGNASGTCGGEFASAEGGTVFLDEVSQLSGTLQAKLLQTLEKGEAGAVNAGPKRRVNVRVIAGSSRELDELAQQGRFRADLYYGLGVLVIRVPALRDRREDILPLVRCFFEEIGEGEGRSVGPPEPELLRLLKEYAWPGNVRQLRECLQSMVHLTGRERAAGGALCLSARWGEGVAGRTGRRSEEKPLAEIERLAMLETLEQHGGNRTCAAEALGISVRTLQRKLKRWNAEHGTQPG